MTMKKTMDNESALAYCLELTKNGEKLSAGWDGANFEESLVWLHLDDRYIIDGEKNRQLIDYIAKEIKYIMPEDRLQLPGHLWFNREDARFVGVDKYYHKDSNIGRFDFKITVPADLWFDEVLIDIQSIYAATPTIEVQFILNNGPVVREMYANYQNQIIEQLESKVIRFMLMEDREEILVLHERTLIKRDEFKEKDGVLSYFLNQLTYSYEKFTVIDIIIDLKAG